MFQVAEALLDHVPAPVVDPGRKRVATRPEYRADGGA
jgi:hypothetical protein